ncbi:Putative S-adenosyl-L-methionine-dependent methyltransferase MidA [Phaffia rhodozyma]|uniref:type II protein arginine methyltransferase n=1 Tax=Phaffia rhodozyma TaxID=264483 RepID=A0A0F7SI58_PHARH|nr:Putative S-adenosyl-L-methionine-dependent methyltransferase MidA [Phaffia rhodozyma]
MLAVRFHPKHLGALYKPVATAVVKVPNLSSLTFRSISTTPITPSPPPDIPKHNKPDRPGSSDASGSSLSSSSNLVKANDGSVPVVKKIRKRKVDMMPSQRKVDGEDHLYDFNPPNPFFGELDSTLTSHRRVTAKDIAAREEPPTQVKMLVRDYIDDHLYNPQYGYFSSPQLEIFTTATKDGYDFTSFQSSFDFENTVSHRYAEYVQLEREKQKARVSMGEYEDEIGKGGQQLWHTPTELFKPWYGRAIASCLVQDYKLNHFPYHDMIIYEMGAGNGTLMTNILDYIEEVHPDVYERTSYRIIEISKKLADKQKVVARENGHLSKVNIINKSIFDWNERVLEPNYFVAMEVLDNFAHDLIRYDLETGLPVQALVVTDYTGGFHMIYEPVTDPYILQYLHLRALLPQPLCQSPSLPDMYTRFPLLRSIRAGLPFAPNLTKPEYVPTKAMMLMGILRDYFPHHRMLFSDFHKLPDAVEGFNAPVVQTRYNGEMIPVSTIMVRQGFFDIFFPTNFRLFRAMYALIQSLPSLTEPPAHLRFTPLNNPTELSFISSNPTAIPPTFFASNPPVYPGLPIPSPESLVRPVRNGSKIEIYTHEEFLTMFAEDPSRTRVKDGTNVMFKWFENASFIF